MKKSLYTIIILFGISSTLISCSKNDGEVSKDLSKSLSKYEDALSNVIIDLKDDTNWETVNNSHTESFSSIHNNDELNKKVRLELTSLVATSQNLLLNTKFEKSVILELNYKEKIFLAAIIKAYNKQLEINPNYFTKNKRQALKNDCVPCNKGNLLFDSYIAKNQLRQGPITGRDVFECAMSAIGVSSLVKVLSGKALASYAARKALLKLVGKVAAKAGLGAIGVALTVGEFAWCLSERA